MEHLFCTILTCLNPLAKIPHLPRGEWASCGLEAAANDESGGLVDVEHVKGEEGLFRPLCKSLSVLGASVTVHILASFFRHNPVESVQCALRHS